MGGSKGREVIEISLARKEDGREMNYERDETGWVRKSVELVVGVNGWHGYTF